jgi:hypothetical protein
MPARARLRMAGVALGVALAAAIVLATASAQEFRSIRPIRRSPGAAVTAASPIEQRVVTRALERILAAWNTPALRGQLGTRFYDADRLADTLATVPRDARVRLLAVESVGVVRQDHRDGSPGAAPRRTSVISVVARTQVEFEDADLGFRAIDGTNEYVFALTETVKP